MDRMIYYGFSRLPAKIFLNKNAIFKLIYCQKYFFLVIGNNYATQQMI